MFRLVEKSFFVIVRNIILLFALVALVAAVALGFMSYKKINNKDNAPVMALAEYQNFIRTQEAQNKTPLSQPQQTNEAINANVENIVQSLNELPDEVVDKNNLAEKITLLIKVKTASYSPKLQLSYAKSLEKLTREIVQTNPYDPRIDVFFRWYDREFAQQVKVQAHDQHIGFKAIHTPQRSGFSLLIMTIGIAGVFIILVMLLAVFRVEQNTRK